MTPVAGGARPILLLHGALGSSAQMDPLAAALVAGGHAVHALDFEGHGAAAATGSPFSIERFAGGIIAHFDQMGWEQADVFGYSMGGYAALHAAQIAPHRFGRIATLGTKFAWDPEVAEREVARLDPVVIEAKVPRFAASLAERHGEARWRDLLKETGELMWALGDSPVVTGEVLSRIEHQIRICVGDRDELVTLDESTATYRALPNGELAVLPNTYHPLERASMETLMAALYGYFGD